MTRPAFHEEENDALRPGCALWQTEWRSLCLIVHERGQRNGTKATRRSVQEVSARGGKIVAMTGHDFEITV